MALQRGMDGSDPIGSGPFGRLPAEEERRIGRASHLGTGSLACPRCDAPIALAAGPHPPHAALACPFCGEAGALRDFLSLARPTRPARVQVRVVSRSGGRP